MQGGQLLGSFKGKKSRLLSIIILFFSKDLMSFYGFEGLAVRWSARL